MKLTSTYDVKISYYSHIFRQTVEIYQSAISFLIDVCEKEWAILKPFDQIDRSNLIEKLIHKTVRNPEPKYGFDSLFYKMPSYLRRAAARTAIGAYSSYDSSLIKWQEKQEGKAPTLQRERNVMPVFYKDNMFRHTGKGTARIKIFHQNDWIWLDIDLNRQDLKYIENHCTYKKECAPSLKRKGRRWYLSFPFEEDVKLITTPIYDQRICAVDLGINNHAVCSIMGSDGTVMARKFLNFAIEKDHLYTILNRIKKAQQHGAKRCPVLWKHANDINTEISRKTADGIIAFAKANQVDVIVFEHLEMKGKKRGSKKQRLHLWRKKEIQKMVEHKAHQNRMRISRICAWNTSALAYDGTGKVKRGTYKEKGEERYNYSICVFPDGKIYHCDLNASYNIGARYFVRELLKSHPVMEGLPDETKASRYGKGSTRTLSTLISLNADINSMSV